MRTLLRFLLTLAVPVLTIVIGWTAVVGLTAAPKPPAEELPWVRTRDGWEQATWLRKREEPHTSPIHPLHAAGFVGGLSVLLLIAGRERPQSSRATNRSNTVAICSEDRL